MIGSFSTCIGIVIIKIGIRCCPWHKEVSNAFHTYKNNCGYHVFGFDHADFRLYELEEGT